jgi:site-specific recombinase XerD
MLGLPIYKLGNVYYLHTRVAGKQVKKSLRTGYKREALLRALALLQAMTKPTPFPPEKYELDASRGIFKADGPEDHARLMEAIEALKTLQSGLPFAAPAVAPAPVAAPTPPLDDPTALMLDELAEKYFLLKKVKQATVNSYRGAADELSAFLGNPRITRIAPSDISRFQEHLANKGNGHRTVDNKTGALRALLGFAKKQGYMRQDNPAAGRSLMNKRQKAKDAWATFEQDELDALLSSGFFRDRITDDTDYTTAVLMAIFTACRVGEITALKKEDFKRSRKGIPFFTIRDSKTAAGIREVPLHPYIFARIIPKLDALKSPSGKLFRYQERDGKGSGNAVGKMLKQNLIAARLDRPKLVFHSLRKYTNNELMELGVSLEHRCRLAGHELDNVNVQTYTKTIGVDELAAAIFPALDTIADSVEKAINPMAGIAIGDLIDPDALM